MTLAAILAAGTTIIGSIVVVLSYVLGGKSAKRKEDLADAKAEIVAHEEKDKVDEMSDDAVVDSLSKWVPDD